MIEFAGTPKSGKSSSIEVISHFFYRHGMNVYAPTEGVSKRTPPALKEDLLYYNTWAACYALMQMFEACYHTDNYELAIFDRGIFDFLAWIDWLWKTEKRIPQTHRDQIQQFILLRPWRDMIDLVVLFECSPDVAMEREHKHKLIKREGRAMNPRSLAALNRAYRRVGKRYGATFTFFKVNTDKEADWDNTPDQLIDTILGLMEARIRK